LQLGLNPATFLFDIVKLNFEVRNLVELFAKAVLEVRLLLVKLGVSLSKLQVDLHLLSFLKFDFLA
jgi:hypothetical protein